MEDKPRHTILIVDDEEAIRNSLQRVFRKEGYGLFTAKSGPDGLERLREPGRNFSLIISDQRMPGMSGAQFFEQAKNIFPKAARILLTGYSDMDAIVEAINKGEIHRYLTKPWNEDDLLFQVREALKQYDLVVENQRLLALTREQNKNLQEMNLHLEEKVLERAGEILAKNEALARLNKDLEANLYNTVRAFGSLLEMHSPLLSGHGRRVSSLSREIAWMLTLPEEEINYIEIAALLHDIGKLGFPQRVLEYQEERWSAEDKILYEQHPRQGQATVQFINRLDHVGLLIRSHHEQYNGKGFPDGLAGQEIPLEARIISLADAYDKIVNLKRGFPSSLKDLIWETRSKQRHLTEEEVWQKAAVAHLQEQSLTRFDPEVVNAFMDYLSSKGIYRGERQLSVEDLREGMVLARPLYSSGGRFLLPHRTTLTNSHVQKLKTLHENDPFQEMIYVEAK